MFSSITALDRRAWSSMSGGFRANAMREFLMHLFWRIRLTRFLIADQGPTAVEYAVMLALLVLVCIGLISSLGELVKPGFQNVIDRRGFG
jgi:pilus assembly protein Flp/PilA